MTLLDLIKSKLGTDASPKDKAPDRLGCAETVTTILNEYDPRIPVMIGTLEFWRFMEKHTELFERIYEPEAGAIVMCATTTNTRPDLLPNGHTGFYLDNFHIASNASATGKFEQNYDRDSWRQLFHYYGGYGVKLYRLLA